MLATRTRTTEVVDTDILFTPLHVVHTGTRDEERDPPFNLIFGKKLSLMLKSIAITF
jgi:hypothetical protein